MDALVLWSNPIQGHWSLSQWLPAAMPPLALAPVERMPLPNLADSPDQALIARCRAGDHAAWEALVRKYSPRVYVLCLRFTGQPQAAEDMTQEVFLRVFNNLDRYHPQSGSFITWVTALTRNLLIDHYRRNRLERNSESLDADGSDDLPALAETLTAGGPGVDNLVWQREIRERVERGLVRMSPELREAVILRDLQDMDYRDIAGVLGVPEGTVKSRINRGRAELARFLRPALAPPAPPKDGDA